MKNILLLIWIPLLLWGCRQPKPVYYIGVSQCSVDEWREQMNKEILREALFFEGVEVEIRSVKDDTRQQIEDIRYFIDNGIDLLIVAPNEAAPLTPIVEEAYGKGIPVILVDRNILSGKYTASVGADNFDIGRTVGEYVANLLQGKGKIIELAGLEGSTPATDRHQGFAGVVNRHPGMELLTTEYAGWLSEEAEVLMEELLNRYPEIDLVFAQNDRMGSGAFRAAQKAGREKEIIFIGIDAITGEGYGVDLVLKGLLHATFIYPTGGDRTMQIAMNILQGKPIERETILHTAVVDGTNARVMNLQTEHIEELDRKIALLNSTLDTYLNRFANQQLIIYAGLTILLLLFILFLAIIKAYRVKHHLNRTLSERNEEITNQKEQLEEQRDQLIDLSRQLEEATHAKLVFFTNISHDFRTPLTLIADPVNQLLEDKQLPEQHKTLLKLVHNNVRILLRLVNQILDFRRYENGKLDLQVTWTDLKEHLKEWVDAFIPVAQKKHIKLSLDIATGSDYQMAIDIEKMERICYNLLSNAFKFTPENGKIRVELSTIEREDKKRVQLIISDTGIGIQENHIRNIFDRFYKTDYQHAGSGIGLALAKAFIDMHGGQIEVESREGIGTTFVVLLPMEESEEITGTVVPAGLSGEAELLLPIREEKEKVVPSPTGETILVIDDNRDIREYIRSFLEKGFTVIEAENGKDGIRQAMKYIPDVIVCDIMMPLMDGIECCGRLKKEVQTSHIPVILLTACSLDEQRIKGFETGADSYISKPFNSKVLEARIRNLIGNRKRLREFFGEPGTTLPETVNDIDKDFLNKFRKIMEENLSNTGLSVEDLGEQMGMSRVQLYRKLKALTNYSPNELLRITRLKKAAGLLASGHLSIAEICYEVGFTSPSYFTKCYKEYFGESPTEFLKRSNL